MIAHFKAATCQFDPSALQGLAANMKHKVAKMSPFNFLGCVTCRFGLKLPLDTKHWLASIVLSCVHCHIEQLVIDPSCMFLASWCHGCVSWKRLAASHSACGLRCVLQMVASHHSSANCSLQWPGLLLPFDISLLGSQQCILHSGF